MDDAERFVGTWRLVELTDASPALLSRLGEQPFGQLIYAADGYMAAVLSNPDRPFFTELERAQRIVSEDDLRAAFDGFVAYCGAWELDTEQQIVSHHLTGSLIPAGPGNTLSRHYQFVDGRLQLRPTDSSDTLVWELSD